MQEGNQAESIIKIISRPARSVKQSSSRLSSGNPAIRVRQIDKTHKDIVFDSIFNSRVHYLPAPWAQRK